MLAMISLLSLLTMLSLLTLLTPLNLLRLDKPARLSFSRSLDLLLNDIDQTNINRDIRDGNWLSSLDLLGQIWPFFLPKILISI